MTKYVELKTAIDAVNDVYYDTPDINLSVDKLEAALLGIPAADVAPVVYGRWDDSGRYTFPSGNTAVRCTNCGCALTESEYHLYDWNYCPICGARMDGDSDAFD